MPEAIRVEDEMVDVESTIAQFEAVLRGGSALESCREALAILERWQWDPDLQPTSREKARELFREFHGCY